MRFLALSGLGSAGLYAYLAFGFRVENSWRSVGLYLAVCAALFSLMLAVRRALRRRASVPLGWVFGFAALFRGVLLFVGLPQDQPVVDTLWADVRSEAVTYDTFLLFDNDLWRYLWDGHVFATGVSPYTATPLELVEGLSPPGLFSDEGWWDVYDNVSFRSYTTVYPPLMLTLFRGLAEAAPHSVFLFKGVLALLDLLVCLLVWRGLRSVGRHGSHVVLYAWNPLPITEVAGSGHAEPLMVVLLLTAVLCVASRRPVAGWLALAGSVLSKLAGGLLAPLFLRLTPVVSWVVFPLALILGLAPFAGSLTDWFAGLAAYEREWVFNPGPWALVAWTAEQLGAVRPEVWADGITRGALLVALAWLGWASRRADLWRNSFALLALAVVLHAAVMPWYVLWFLPLAVVVGSRSGVAFSGLVLLSYLFYVDQVELVWWRLVEYGVLLVILVAELWLFRARRANPSALGPGSP